MKKSVPSMLARITSEKAYASIAIALVAGCTTTHVQWDAAQMREQVVDYLSNLANNLVYALTVEKLLQLEIPPKAQWMRVMLNELTPICACRCCRAPSGSRVEVVRERERRGNADAHDRDESGNDRCGSRWNFWSNGNEAFRGLS